MKRSVQFIPAALSIAAFAAVCQAQTSPTFTSHVSGGAAVPANIFSVDLNNDGIPDIISDTASNPNGFSIQLGNGDGTFKAPVFDSMNNGTVAPAPMATGDFNNDGKPDLAVVLPGKKLLVVFPGDGNGSFQSDKYSTIAFPSGQTFASAPVLAADFNHDGKIDLVAVAAAGDYQTVYILPGDGAGGFKTPQPISNLLSSYTVGNMVVGDFDGNTKADVAFTAVYGCDRPGSTCVTTLHALFGDGSFGFLETTPYDSYDLLQISAGDLDSDGKTDIVSFDQSAQQFLALYGDSGRVFPSYAWNVNNPRFPLHFANGWYGPFQIADFDGDGHMDIAGFDANTLYETTQYGIGIWLGTANRGQFTEAPSAYVPGAANPVTPFGTSPLAIDSNGDGVPDLVVNIPASASANNSYPSTLVTDINTTTGGNWGGCTYPKKAQGIHLCTPANTNSGTSVSFKAAATSFGILRKIELWVDGAKLAQNFHAWEHNAWFNYSGTLAAGSHHATLFAADIDNRLQRLDYTFTTGSTAGCSAPSSNGVHVCSPVNGAAVGSPVTVQAATTIPGTLARMEIWVDGAKLFTEKTSTTFTTSLNLGAGSHRFDIYAVNTAGAKYETTVYATVK